MEQVNYFTESLMDLNGLSQILSQMKYLSLATKNKKFGILNSDLFPLVMKNAELILLVSTFVPLRKFMIFLESKIMKLTQCSGSM